jgi:hypothetical protein
VVGWRGDGSCEDAEGVFLDEAAEGGEGGFGVGGAEVHCVLFYWNLFLQKRRGVDGLDRRPELDW